MASPNLLHAFDQGHNLGYIIEFASATCFNTTPNVGNDNNDSDAEPERSGRTAPIVLTAGLINNTVDAGFICPTAQRE